MPHLEGAKHKHIVMSAEEFAARIITALQTPGKMQFTALENEQGQLVMPAPTPTFNMGAMASDGRLIKGPNTTEGAATGGTAAGNASLATIVTETRAPRYLLPAGLPLTARADGTAGPITGVPDDPWTPIIPQTVTADGAGLPPATALIALSGGQTIDVMIWMTVDTVAGANQYQFDFRTDPLAAVGGIAVVEPDWTAIELPLPANGTTPGNTYGHRMMTSVISSAFGIAEGANADWPNAAQVTFYGFYRFITP